MPNEQKLAFFPLMLRDVATEWWDVLPNEVRGDWDRALAAFIERFIDNELIKWQKAGQFWTRNQNPGESVEEYAASLQKIAKSVGVGEEVAKHAFIRGLRANLRGYVIPSNATTFDDLVKARYWGRNTRDSRGDGDQSCGTTAAMGLSFSHVHEN